MDEQGDSYIPPQTLFAGGINIENPTETKYCDYIVTVANQMDIS